MKIPQTTAAATKATAASIQIKFFGDFLADFFLLMFKLYHKNGIIYILWPGSSMDRAIPS